TQLMSETAADSARWLRMEEYDVRNPEHNLRLGGRHFSRLYSRLEDIPKTLMAYNAGLSRLRSWERSFAGMPSDLLAEAAPFPETRNYIRKILVSAVYYGALYYDSSLEQTVLSFFPGLRE
ncbi:MAG: transglycosylase SLT domain-containing protein, partial [Bacteroidales bacterium]